MHDNRTSTSPSVSAAANSSRDTSSPCASASDGFSVRVSADCNYPPVHIQDPTVNAAPSSTGGSGEEKSQYVVSSSGHAAHPDEIIASCKALQAYIQKVQDDADRELKTWEDAIAARELAEKRRVAPGWLDSESRLLEPEKRANSSAQAGNARGNLMDVDVSSAEASGLQHTPMPQPNREGDELDRAFGGLGLNK